MRFLVVILIAALLVGCTPQENGDGSEEARITVLLPGLTVIGRFVDCEARVALWVYSGVEKGGLVALPLEETALDYSVVCGNR